MDAWSLIWWVSMLVTTGALAMWYFVAATGGQRRLCLTILVVNMAAHLLVGHNKLWVGTKP